MDHQIQKPKLFISHAHSDSPFVGVLQSELEKVFANGISVFCTSSPSAITVGMDWLSEIEHKLETTQAVITIITPTSIERPWIWFELGATWSKGRSGKCRIYPLCAPEITLSNVPSPLNRLQVLSMGSSDHLKLLFRALIEQFGFGNLTAFKAANITKRIPKYEKVKIEDLDINERTLYSGPYAGYSDEELEEVIDSEFVLPDISRYAKFGILSYEPEGYISNGKLIHFRQVDQQLKLQLGTARRLLERVAAKRSLVPIQKSENIIRFAEQARQNVEAKKKER